MLVGEGPEVIEWVAGPEVENVSVEGVTFPKDVGPLFDTVIVMVNAIWFVTEAGLKEIELVKSPMATESDETVTEVEVLAPSVAEP